MHTYNSHECTRLLYVYGQMILIGLFLLCISVFMFSLSLARSLAPTLFALPFELCRKNRKKSTHHHRWKAALLWSYGNYFFRWPLLLYYFTLNRHNKECSCCALSICTAVHQQRSAFQRSVMQCNAMLWNCKNPPDKIQLIIYECHLKK